MSVIHICNTEDSNNKRYVLDSLGAPVWLSLQLLVPIIIYIQSEILS